MCNIKLPKKLPKGVKILENGQMEVTISYDVTKHGHSFSKPRNYNVQAIALMINDPKTQEAIKNGYAKGYYGHTKRNPNKGYLPSELDGNGNEVEPICMTTALSISGNIITHTQRIFNTDDGCRVQQLILNGAVGFSNVWDIGKKKFFGYDVVVSPNFAGNRIVVDSICEGNCAISEDFYIDEVTSQLPTDEAKEALKYLLEKYGDENITAINRLKSKSKQLVDEKDTQENIALKYREEADENALKIVKLQQQVKELQTQLEKEQQAKEDYKAELTEEKILKDEIQAELDEIKEILKKEGVAVVEDSISFDDNPLNKILKPAKDAIPTDIYLDDIHLKKAEDFREKTIGINIFKSRR